MSGIRDTLPSGPIELAETVGGPMLPRRARYLAAVLTDRGITAVATRLDATRSVVRVPPEQLRRAEPLAFAFAEGIRFRDSEGWS